MPWNCPALRDLNVPLDCTQPYAFELQSKLLRVGYIAASIGVTAHESFYLGSYDIGFRV